MVRDLTDADVSAILRMNLEHEAKLSPMSAERLCALREWADYFRVCELDHRVVGFLIGVREKSTYDSENYRAFADRLDIFFYVDRVVVDTAAQGRGVGHALYQDFFAIARDQHVPLIAAEFDVDPPNPASAAFHARHGFTEIGTRTYRSGDRDKKVSLQTASSVHGV